jgi:hypothetical protein
MSARSRGDACGQHVYGAVDGSSGTSRPCGSRAGRTRTSPTTAADPPSTAGEPARRVLRHGAVAGGPEGERRTTSAGRPAGLRLTTQWHRGNPTVGSSPSRPRRWPLGSPPGAGAEPHRQSGGRSPTRRGRWDDGQGRPLGRLLRGAFLVPGAGFPQLCAHVHRAGSPDRPREPLSRAICPVQSTGDVPSLCTEPRSPLRTTARPVDAVCTRRWTVLRPGRRAQQRQPLHHPVHAAARPDQAHRARSGTGASSAARS